LAPNAPFKTYFCNKIGPELPPQSAIVAAAFGGEAATAVAALRGGY
jgi:hypothetical protein